MEKASLIKEGEAEVGAAGSKKDLFGLGWWKTDVGIQTLF